MCLCCACMVWTRGRGAAATTYASGIVVLRPGSTAGVVLLSGQVVAEASRTRSRVSPDGAPGGACAEAVRLADRSRPVTVGTAPTTVGVPGPVEGGTGDVERLVATKVKVLTVAAGGVHAAGERDLHRTTAAARPPVWASTWRHRVACLPGDDSSTDADPRATGLPAESAEGLVMTLVMVAVRSSCFCSPTVMMRARPASVSTIVSSKPGVMCGPACGACMASRCPEPSL